MDKLSKIINIAIFVVLLNIAVWNIMLHGVPDTYLTAFGYDIKHAVNW